MKQTLQQHLEQQLAITPQLKQSIRILQLSAVDLNKEIQEALDNNPLLEIANDPFSSIQEQPDTESFSNESSNNEEFGDEFSDEFIINNQLTAANYANLALTNEELPIYEGKTEESLADYLYWQLSLTPFSDQDRAIALMLIDAIDENGYLNIELDEIVDALDSPEITRIEVEITLKRIQHFDPIGVAARNLQECLLIQLDALAPNTPFLNETRLLIREHLDKVAKNDFRYLLKMTNLNEHELKQALILLKTLTPHPGETYQTKETDFVIPDVVVDHIGGRWLCKINDTYRPNIYINETYSQVKGTKEDLQFINHNLQQADWLIKSLNYRFDTLLRVAQAIVDHQQAFFDSGPEYLRPLTLVEIAQLLELHESTISRATTQKYLYCSRGIFELKYFFSSHLNTRDGEDASSTAIKAMIKNLIAKEDNRKPLSDSKIASLLDNEGISVARRTIAKYREMMSIPPSSQRKQL